MRLEDSGQIWLPGRTAGALVPPVDIAARTIRPEHPVRPVERALGVGCRIRWRCLPPVPYWERLAIDDALAPPVYPVPYWASLRAARLQAEGAAREAASSATTPAPSPPPAPTPRVPQEPQARQASSAGDDAPTKDRPLYAMARIGDLPPQAKVSLTRRVETTYEVQRFAAPGNLVDLVI